MDQRVIAAIDEAVQEVGETPALAKKIAAWLESLSNGNARLADRDTTDRHLELLFQSVTSVVDDEK